MKKLILITLFLGGCAQKGEMGPTMFFYGDSITAGSNQTYAQPSYPQLIAMNVGFDLSNQAHGGTAMFHSNSVGDTPIYAQVMSGSWRSQDMVFILPGTNDCIYYGADPANIAVYKQALKDITDKALASPIGVVYIGTTLKVIDEPAVTNRFFQNSCGQEYASANAEAVINAGSPKIKLLDFRSCFNPTWSNTQDGLHPNKQGYAELYQCYEVLK